MSDIPQMTTRSKLVDNGLTLENSKFWNAFKSRDDLNKFGCDALLLFALQLRFEIEDISLVASNSLTEGSDDKKADLVYIDSELGHAVVAQTYICKNLGKDQAPANKASDLNTAVSWLLSRPINDLPVGIRTHAEELRQSINDEKITPGGKLISAYIRAQMARARSYLSYIVEKSFIIND